MRHILICLVWILILVPAGRAQPIDQSDRTWLINAPKSAFATHGSRGYLAALESLTDREDEALASDNLRSLYLDLLGAQLAFVGQEARAIESGDRAFTRRRDRAPDPDAASELVDGHHAADAVGAIIDAARGRRIVMINEEHRSSRQRAFANEILAPLRKAGFTHLALETLSEDTDQLSDRGYPRLNSGTYTKDPALGDLVRRALELGFVVFGYEADPQAFRPREDDTSPLDAQNRREAGQARNIFERSLRDDPNARVLVYAGRDHIAEDEGGPWTPMGVALRRLSGVDPLSVSLISMCEHSDRPSEHWAYHAAEQAGWLGTGPVVAAADDGSLWSAMPGVIDVHVFFPRTRFVNGRPDWMAMGGIRTPVEIDTPDFDTPVLLQAVIKNEARDAVPIDQAVWIPGEPRPLLLLRPGTYTARAVNREGIVLFERRISVD